MQAPTDKIDIPTIRKIKESAKLTLKEQFGIPKSVPLFALVAIKDEALRNFILDGLSAIGIAHVALIPEAQTPSTSWDVEWIQDSVSETQNTNTSISYTGGENSIRRYSGQKNSISENEVYAFDFFVYDEEQSGVDIVRLMRSGVVPITTDRTVFSGVFKDFNPMKFEWNGFFFKSLNPFCVFEKIVSYTENIKFPEDKRILLKNVIETF